MAFIRRVKTKSGATAVHIAYKSHGRITRIDHIGSAHTSDDLVALVSLARKRLQGQQCSLFESPPSRLQIGLAQTASTLLFYIFCYIVY
ncbi:hypothetical protein CO180_04520 [candidate division WWE3 bacterium CG_4_9_14_3_um_filter_41_6]|uniref:Uncharacterized protein n=1 Tax=candidate division WWE3 bacterium CG_4_10_14_0_2_um_filter_41_14 TaxID=1975072 RepID=A0A2M7TIF9_UNCKA|nr:MAG: hypothetical protein COY32_03715 [candidate division WWE3 bacterium CG_4_10_14_0_2_um_filter_41_14]PJA37976.1 MAG: hypothetical protein CO180_04520 [candidate division WWE3 bacterium CG_4_9_14_3_um_filter_41_6]